MTELTPNIRLVSVYRHKESVMFLYDLLTERMEEPDTNISHKAMPTIESHAEFVRSQPYHAWYIIVDDEHGDWMGACYLSRNKEIGIHVKKQYRGKGIGAQAVSALMTKWPMKRYLLNIAHGNERAIRFWKNLGAVPLQITMTL